MPRGAWYVDGQRIASLRALHGLTQDALAERAGIGEASTKKAERNGPLELKTIQAIAQALGVAPADLYASIDVGRVEACLTRKALPRDVLARRAGLNPSELRSVETGGPVGAEIVKRLARALGCAPDHILSQAAPSRSLSQPNPAYRAALILGEQRAEPGIHDAIGQLLTLRAQEQELGGTAWGAVGLADLSSRQAIHVSPLKECPAVLRSAHQYADEAIRIMPSAVSYLKKGLLCTDDGLVSEAAEYFERARYLGYDETRLSPEYGTFLAATGRYDEAIACAIEAIARDHERRSHAVNLGEIYYMAGKVTEAKAQLDRAEREYPDAWAAAALKGLIAVSDRDWRSAREHFDRARGLPRLGPLRTLLHTASDLIQALADHRSIGKLEERIQLPGMRLVEYAVFYVTCRKLDECVHVLETLVEYRYPAMSLMLHWPIFAPLHTTPRFEALRRRWRPDAVSS